MLRKFEYCVRRRVMQVKVLGKNRIEDEPKERL